VLLNKEADRKLWYWARTCTYNVTSCV